MKTLCIIPARSGSKGIKHKNIILLNRKPLIHFTISFAKKLKFIDKIVFSSDSSKYNKLALKYKNIEISDRPKNLSEDKTLMLDVVKYEFSKQVKKKNYFDQILLLQPTCPFRKVNDFNVAFNFLKKNIYDTVLTISKVKDHPDRLKIIRNKKLLNYNSKLKEESLIPRQNLETIYIRAGSMYFFKSKLLEKNKIVGKKVYGIEVKGKYSINIDEMNDLILAKHYMKK